MLRLFQRRGLLTEDTVEDMLTWQASGGCSLDASVRTHGSDSAGRERLLRYCARPPFALERGAVRVDVEDFTAATNAGDWARAVELYGGDFLHGFHLSASPAFESWIAAWRVRLRANALSAAKRLADEQERAGEIRAAIESLRTAIRIAPTEESVVRRVMMLLQRSGARAAALEAFRALEDVLRVELDTAPENETRELALRIRGSSAIRSLGVLPWANLTGSPDQEHVSDGLTDIIITELASADVARITSRQSSLQLKGATIPLADVGPATVRRWGGRRIRDAPWRLADRDRAADPVGAGGAHLGGTVRGRARRAPCRCGAHRARYALRNHGHFLMVANLNDDAFDDVMIAVHDGSGQPAVVTSYLGSGSGVLTQAAEQATIYFTAKGVASGDFNDDGKSDLVVALADNRASAVVSYGMGAGQFAAAVAVPSLSSDSSLSDGTSSVAAADLNGDGRDDLILSRQDVANMLVIRLSTGGSFSPPTLVALPSPINVASGDINGDGRSDAVVANLEHGTLSLLLGRGDGTFALLPSIAVGPSPARVTVADFDENGFADVAVADLADHKVRVLLSIVAE